MYDYGYSYGYGLIGGNTYNPLINYDWSTTTTSGLRYLKDVGSTPTYNASMYFGRGAYFNGVDQSIEPITYSDDNIVENTFCAIVEMNSTEGYILSSGWSNKCRMAIQKRNTNKLRFSVYNNTKYTSFESDVLEVGVFNLVCTYDYESDTLKAYRNGIELIQNSGTNLSVPFGLICIGSVYSGGVYYKGTLKDLYVFSRTLTQSEITQSYEQPEAFYAMAQADSTCVLNMPMCETDGYVRNMKSYSEGTNLTTNGTFDTLTGWSLNTNALAGVTNTNNTLNYSNAHGDYAETKQLNKAIVGMYYLVVFDVVSKIDSTTNVFFQFGRTLLPATGLISSITIGTKIAVVQATHTDGFSISVRTDGIIEIDNVKTYQLSGAYPITNYTTSVRDNAKNLQYGLQTCKFVRDSLGVIQSASDYLECNGTGYAIIQSHTDTVNINMTVNPTSLSGNLLSGGVTKTLTGLTLNADNDVVISNVTPTGAITLASGFSGTIKTYTEELV